jgi:hypothetical protein
MNFELGQSAVDLLQIRCRQLDLGSFDVLLQNAAVLGDGRIFGALLVHTSLQMRFSHANESNLNR